MLEMFLADKETESIVMIGEIGGSAEEDAAQFLKRRGQARPQEADGRLHRRPHRAARAAAWAMPAPSSPAARAAPRIKIAAMEAAGITVSPSPARLGKTLVEVLEGLIHFVVSFCDAATPVIK